MASCCSFKSPWKQRPGSRFVFCKYLKLFVYFWVKIIRRKTHFEYSQKFLHFKKEQKSVFLVKWKIWLFFHFFQEKKFWLSPKTVFRRTLFAKKYENTLSWIQTFTICPGRCQERLIWNFLWQILSTLENRKTIT